MKGVEMQVLVHEKYQSILQITLNRPEKLNALNDDVLSALTDCITEAREDNTVKAILLTGTGKAFCAGADIERLAACDAESGYFFACKGQHIFNQLESLGKPSIAAINGFALGGGCELAMAATLRIAAQSAYLGQPEVNLGVIPGYGGTQRLSRLVGKGRAMELCLTGKKISAQTALHWGLVNEVTEDDNLLSLSREWLNLLISKAPHAIRATMEVIHRGYDLTLQDALHLEALQFGLACGNSDKVEGVNAFLEKRKPVFAGG